MVSNEKILNFFNNVTDEEERRNVFDQFMKEYKQK